MSGLDTALREVRDEYEAEIATLQARVERAEAAALHAQNLCSESLLRRADSQGQLMLAQSTITELTGQVERLREASKVIIDGHDYLHESGKRASAVLYGGWYIYAIERLRAALGDANVAK